MRRDRVRLIDIDYVGLGLIAVGLGSLQVMLDRGEDYDWFGSPVIRMFALLAAVGIVGATAWLLLTDRPVVNLRALGDRNFAIGVVMVSAIGVILYSSNLLIPAFAQQWMGYTGLLAGLLLSPGAALMIVLIPVVGRFALPRFQTRHLLAFGFLVLGLAAGFASRLTAQLDFSTLATFRAIQTVGLAFLFVPNSTIAYSTIPRALNADATALYAMFRNVAGSIGISTATALAAERLQVHRAYLAGHLSPFDQGFVDTLSRYTRTLQAMGRTAAEAQQTAMGLLNHVLTQQAAVLAYADLFALTAAASFCVVPLTFLFRGSTSGRRH